MSANLNAIRGLVLYMTERRLPVNFVLSKGYTSGQVMRALVMARSDGVIAVVDGRTQITELGKGELEKLAPRATRGQWLMPLDEERIESISIEDIFLPSDFSNLTK